MSIRRKRSANSTPELGLTGELPIEKLDDDPVYAEIVEIRMRAARHEIERETRNP